MGDHFHNRLVLAIRPSSGYDMVSVECSPFRSGQRIRSVRLCISFEKKRQKSGPSGNLPRPDGLGSGYPDVLYRRAVRHDAGLARPRLWQLRGGDFPFPAEYSRRAPASLRLIPCARKVFPPSGLLLYLLLIERSESLQSRIVLSRHVRQLDTVVHA